MDMGIKPIYKLTTEDGHTIRTTGNHPYLKKLSRTKKSAFADLVNLTGSLIDWIDTLVVKIHQIMVFVKWVWTRRELNPVDLGYQSNLANLPSPHHDYSIKNSKWTKV